MLFGGHLEPTQTLTQNVKNRRNYLQKVSLARENRTNLERARGIEMFHAPEPVCESLQAAGVKYFELYRVLHFISSPRDPFPNLS